MKHLTLSLALVAALSSMTASQASAAADYKATVRALKNTPVAELPAKAAQTVSASKAEDREAVTATVIRAVASKSPSALVSVVASIAKTSPEVAPVAAATAATLAPKQAEMIALAAAKAAPGAVEKIAVAIAKVLPASASTVASSLASIAPSSATKIFAAVSETTQVARRTTSKAAGSAGALGTISTSPGPIDTSNPTRQTPTQATGEVNGADPLRNYGN